MASTIHPSVPTVRLDLTASLMRGGTRKGAAAEYVPAIAAQILRLLSSPLLPEGPCLAAAAALVVAAAGVPGRGVIENKHSTDVKSQTPLPRSLVLPFFLSNRTAMTIASFNQVTEYPVGLQTRRVLMPLSCPGRDIDLLYFCLSSWQY